MNDTLFVLGFYSTHLAARRSLGKRSSSALDAHPSFVSGDKASGAIVDGTLVLIDTSFGEMISSVLVDASVWWLVGDETSATLNEKKPKLEIGGKRILILNI